MLWKFKNEGQQNISAIINSTVPDKKRKENKQKLKIKSEVPSGFEPETFCV